MHKPLPEFAYVDRQRGTLQGHCRSCHAVYRRAHYLANKPDYIRRAIAQVHSRLLDNRRRLLAYLRTHPCVDCGKSDPVVLEFDHRDPAGKVATVTALVHRRRWASVQAEIAKCDVRCVNCHRRRTAEQFGWGKWIRR